MGTPTPNFTWSTLPWENDIVRGTQFLCFLLCVSNVILKALDDESVVLKALDDESVVLEALDDENVVLKALDDESRGIKPRQQNIRDKGYGGCNAGWYDVQEP